MKRKGTKIIIRMLLVVIGVPTLLVAAVLGWGYISDRTNGSITSSGVTRRYLLYVPKTYDRSKPTPLVISIHPAATWPAFQMEMSRWNDVADEHGFIVVYPAGSGAFFGGFSPGAHVWPGGPHTLPRDVKFISDLIARIAGEYNLDPNRIYVNGMSNGGGMAYALSCELAGKIAAVGVVAPALPPDPEHDRCDPKPVPAMAFHGTADKFAPYLGGKSPVAPRQFPNIPDWIAHVARRNQCQGGASDDRVSSSIRRLAYANCLEDAEVVLYTIEGGGHTWPGGKPLPEWIAGHTNAEIDASRVMWEFFNRHPLQVK